MGDTFPNPVGDSETQAGLTAIYNELVDVNTELGNILSELQDIDTKLGNIQTDIDNLFKAGNAASVSGSQSSSGVIAGLSGRFFSCLMLRAYHDDNGAISITLNGQIIYYFNETSSPGYWPATSSTDMTDGGMGGWFVLNNVFVSTLSIGVPSGGSAVRYIGTYEPGL